MEERLWWTAYAEELCEPWPADDPKEYTRYTNASELLARCRTYLDFCAEHPRVTEKIMTLGKQVVRVPVYRRRAPTFAGLVAAIGLHRSLFYTMERENTPQGRVLAFIRDVIEDEKLVGAHAGEYCSALTNRELCLAPNVEQPQHTNVDVVSPAHADILDERYAANLMHPDDPDPFVENRPLYSAAQLEQGMPFIELPKAE